MDRIIEKILGVILGILFIFVFLFGLCWYSDGFNIAWTTFLGKQSLEAISEFLSVIGVWDWFIAAIVALIICGLIESLIGRRLSNRKAGIVLDIASFIVSFIGYILLFK